MSLVSRRKGEKKKRSVRSEVACRIPAPASLEGVRPQRTALPQDGVEGDFATVDAAAAHAVGLSVAHTLSLLGLLQPAHAVRREGRGAPVSGPTRLPIALRGSTARSRNRDAVKWGRSWGPEVGTLGLGGMGTSDLLGAQV